MRTSPPLHHPKPHPKHHPKPQAQPKPQPNSAPEPTLALPWPRPPACLPANRLHEPPENARITVAGLVILRQRPGTAKGVIFLTLEDETGIVNIIVWRKSYDRFRRAVIAGRLLRVTGRLQRAHSVSHLIAEDIEDISPMLDLLLSEQGRTGDPAFAPPQDLV